MPITIVFCFFSMLQIILEKGDGIMFQENQTRFCDLKEPDLFIVLSHNEPANLLCLFEGKAKVVTGFRHQSMAMLGSSVDIAPQEPVKVLNKYCFVGD